MKMPQQRPGKSEQSVGTPPEFLAKVEMRFGALWTDLAASPENAVAGSFFTETDDSLSQDWDILSGLSWLNPPFARIGPWVEKAANGKAPVLVLVPASVGSNWYCDWGFRQAQTIFLKGRLTFVGHRAPYPKDLMLLAYNVNDTTPGKIEIWDWRSA